VTFAGWRRAGVDLSRQTTLATIAGGGVTFATMKPKLRRVAWTLLVLLLLAVLLAAMPFDPPKWSAQAIAARVDLLNEKAAIQTPHLTLGKDIRAANLALFEKVERGTTLTAEESATYRVLYQTILKDNQEKLALLDRELTVLTNYMPAAHNNVGTLGIEGSHDHHDASSLANLAALRADLARLDAAEGAFGSPARVRAAIEAWKDLDDVILHMATAPQTKSVPRTPETPVDDLQAPYEVMMLHFKRAQFEPVNSPGFAAEVHAALDAYDALVVLVQDRIYAQLNPLERSFAGRWGSWRSLAPPLRDVTADRLPRGREAPPPP
jgi:hypothetical protein